VLDPVGQRWATFTEDELHAVTPALVIFLWPVAALVQRMVWARFCVPPDDADAADGVLRVRPESTNRITPPKRSRLMARLPCRQQDASTTPAANLV
jgi:hypothetical protein